MRKEKILEILENAKDENGAVPMRLVRTAFDKLPEPCKDTISRQAGINAVDTIGHIATMPDGDKCLRRSAVKYTLSMLPPAKPNVPDTNVGDMIRRQAAIDEIEKLVIPEDMCVFEILSHIELAIGTLPPEQPEEAIPVSWIESEIAEMKSTGEASSYILAELIGAMVRKWREEQHE